MIDAAAIFPLDAASHCGYEEENRDKQNVSRDFGSLFPLGKQLVSRRRGCERTGCFKVVNCFIFSGSNRENTFVVWENKKHGGRSDAQLQSFPQSFIWGNSVSNSAPVLLGSTQPLGTGQLSFPHLWVPWNVFCAVVLFPGRRTRRFLVNCELFRCWSLLLCPPSLSRLRIKPPPSSQRGGRAYSCLPLLLGPPIVYSCSPDWFIPSARSYVEDRQPIASWFLLDWH